MMDESRKEESIRVIFNKEGFIVGAKIEGIEDEGLRDILASWFKNWFEILHDDIRLCKTLSKKQPLATRMMMLKFAKFGADYELKRAELVNGKK